MKWLLLLTVVGCATEFKRTDLSGSIECGSSSCGSGEVCYSEESGEQCLVNPDAGIGQYQEFGWHCGTLPDGCVYTPDCITDQWTRVSEDGRHIDHLCI
ncbi:MAG: hypothetical protein QM831_45155 [Kofleriaceae bacterium]